MSDILASVSVGDQVDLYTLKGDVIQGVVTMKNDGNKILGIQKDDGTESSYLYGLFLGCDIKTKPNNATKVSVVPEIQDYTKIQKIAIAQGISKLKEWISIENAYRNAVKVGETAKKFNRIGSILAKLDSIKGKFADSVQYDIVYNFFNSCQDEPKAKPTADEKPVPVNTIPVQQAISTENRKKTGTIYNAVPSRSDSTKCRLWQIRGEDGNMYQFQEQDIADSALRNTLKNSFKNGTRLNIKVTFYENYTKTDPNTGKLYYYVNNVHSTDSQPAAVSTNVKNKPGKIEEKYRNAVTKYLSNSAGRYDKEVLPVFLEYFDIVPDGKTANYISIIYVRSGALSDAIKFMENEKVKKAMGSDLWRQRIHEIYRKARKYDKAYKVQKELIANTTNDALKADHLGKALAYQYEKGEYQEVLNHFEQWLATDTGKNTEHNPSA